MANISGETLRTFFHDFSEWFVSTYWDEWVTWPEGQELSQMLSIYSKLGMTGAFGSTDGVHFPWNRAPSGSTWLFKGKEGYPSLAANMTCGHNLKIYNCTQLFGGATERKAAWNRRRRT